MFGITMTEVPSSSLDEAIFDALRTRLIGDGAYSYPVGGPSYQFMWGPRQAGAATNDDLPAWWLEVGTSIAYQAIVAGADGTDLGSSWGTNIYLSGAATDQIEVAAAADAAAGWWWLAARNATTNTLLGLVAGASARRYPADVTLGRQPRFMLFERRSSGPAMYCLPPRVLLADGGFDTYCDLDWFSPLGKGVVVREPGSPLPRMIAPIYPVARSPNGAVAAAVYGELDCVMQATDGYVWGEEAQHGWRVYGDAAVGWYALRSPATFEAVTL